MRDGMMSCLEWCKYGKDCVGEVIFNRYMEGRAAGLKKQILAELETTFGQSADRMKRAGDILHFAEELVATEPADWHIVMPASLLSQVGVTQSPADSQSGSGPMILTDDPVEKLLLRSGMKMDDINAICGVLYYLGSEETDDRESDANYRVLHDAILLASLHETDGRDSPGSGSGNKLFLTDTGGKLAGRIGVTQES